MEQEKVSVQEVAESVKRIVIRLDIGTFEISGPRQNIVAVESLVAFSTIVNELYREGYDMVAPQEYAERYGITVDQVNAKISNDGGLLLLLYESGGARHEAVPLEERRVSPGHGPHLTW